MMGTVRRVCCKVKRWRNATIVLRWTAPVFWKQSRPLNRAGYAAYNKITAAPDEAITLAFCWSHLRCRLFDIARVAMRRSRTKRAEPPNQHRPMLRRDNRALSGRKRRYRVLSRVKISCRTTWD
jgi:hypothetical protein